VRFPRVCSSLRRAGSLGLCVCKLAWGRCTYQVALRAQFILVVCHQPHPLLDDDPVLWYLVEPWHVYCDRLVHLCRADEADKLAELPSNRRTWGGHCARARGRGLGSTPPAARVRVPARERSLNSRSPAQSTTTASSRDFSLGGREETHESIGWRRERSRQPQSAGPDMDTFARRGIRGSGAPLSLRRGHSGLRPSSTASKQPYKNSRAPSTLGSNDLIRPSPAPPCPSLTPPHPRTLNMPDAYSGPTTTRERS
jgi:hypothetical protein